MLRALTTCRECGREVSYQAWSCPHCGAPRPGIPDWQGTGFEWRSSRTVLGYPLIHVAVGRDARGKLRVACGVIAIGQFAIGLITVAQFGVGLLFGLGQFILGFTAVAQVAVAGIFAVGQLAVGYAAIGQIVLAYYGLAQGGWAAHLLSPESRDAAAVEFFQALWAACRQFWR